MKRILELVKPAAVLSLCIAGTLLSGCSVQMAMSMKGYELNPKVIEVNQSWINRFAKLEQTKDVDILHNLCKPTYIQQYSNGEKSYTYMAYNEDAHKYKSITFLFNQNRTLKKVVFQPSIRYTPAYETTVVFGKDLLPLLETLPSNPTRQLLKKKLGVPIILEDEGSIMTYSYPDPALMHGISFYINPNGVAEYMIIPKIFYDFAKKNHARFNVKTIYVSERKINEAESAVIEKCER
ncbi:MAG: hypothetical protein NC112_06610 [Oxalobacter formigenes]|nr:hypothetical protein [Oxalobacter formigenes]